MNHIASEFCSSVRKFSLLSESGWLKSSTSRCHTPQLASDAATDTRCNAQNMYTLAQLLYSRNFCQINIFITLFLLTFTLTQFSTTTPMSTGQFGSPLAKAVKEINDLKTELQNIKLAMTRMGVSQSAGSKIMSPEVQKLEMPDVKEINTEKTKLDLARQIVHDCTAGPCIFLKK